MAAVADLATIFAVTRVDLFLWSSSSRSAATPVLRAPTSSCRNTSPSSPAVSMWQDIHTIVGHWINVEDWTLQVLRILGSVPLRTTHCSWTPSSAILTAQAQPSRTMPAVEDPKQTLFACKTHLAW